MSTQETLLTTEQFIREYGRSPGRHELVQGEVLEMAPPGGRHGKVALNVGSILRTFVRERGLGEVVVESGFALRRGPDTVRGPDVAFVRQERLGPGGPPRGFFEGAPDLAVEVVSPDDSAADMEVRVQDYLAAGAAQVWLIYPDSRTVHMYMHGGVSRWYGEGETLPGGDILPGFSAPVRELFD